MEIRKLIESDYDQAIKLYAQLDEFRVQACPDCFVHREKDIIYLNDAFNHNLSYPGRLDLDAFDLSQIFIDERFQGKGYDKAATKLVLGAIKQDGKYGKDVLCYIEGNDSAKKRYESFGFVEIDCDGDEIIMELQL